MLANEAEPEFHLHFYSVLCVDIFYFLLINSRPRKLIMKRMNCPFREFIDPNESFTSTVAINSIPNDQTWTKVPS